MAYFIVILAAYLLGCSNMTLYLSRLRHVDMRSAGSGNLGASNATILLGWGAGIFVAVHDIGKAVVAVAAARWLFPDLAAIGAVAGVSCVLGHIFPFYLKFKGGKGFASYLGMTLALNWKLALAVLALVVIVTVVTDYIVVGTALTVCTVPAYIGVTSHSMMLTLILIIATAVILFKHRMNFVRIYRGTEIGLRSTFRGEHRAK